MPHHIFYRLSILFVLINTYSCYQKGVDNSATLPSKTEATKTLPAVIYKSDDLGRTWSSFAKGIPQDATLSGIKQYGNQLYVSTDYHGIFVANNGQDNWKALNNDYLKKLDINCLEVTPNSLIIGTLGHGILISEDNGLNWKSPAKNNIDAPIRAFIRVQNKLYAGTDSGIFISIDNGNTWTAAFNQLQILGFTTLNDKIYAATQNGALMSADNGATWASIYDGDALHDIANDGQYIYAMTIGQQLLKTQNDGEVWENAQNGISRPPNFYTNELQHIGADIFSAQWIGIYHSTDNGNNWNKLNNLPDSTAFSTLEVTDYGIITGISIR